MRIILDPQVARRVVGENAKPGPYSRPTKPRVEGSKELRDALHSALDDELPPHVPPANGRPVDLYVAGHLLERVERARQVSWSHMQLEDYVSGLFAALADPDAARAAAPERLQKARIDAESRAARMAAVAAENEAKIAKARSMAEMAKVREAEQTRRREEERLHRQVKLTGHLTASQGILSGQVSRRKLAVGYGKSTRWYDLEAKGELAAQLDSFIKGELVSVEGDPWGLHGVKVTAIAPADTIRYRLTGPQGNGINVQPALKPGFTHVDVPRAGVTCKSLSIKYAPAIVRWDYIGGRTVPIISGIVVATDDCERLIAALEQRKVKKVQRGAAEPQHDDRGSN